MVRKWEVKVPSILIIQDAVEDKKHEDRVDEENIPDSEASKPDGWDENASYEISDEDAKKPEGWLDDELESIPGPDAEKPTEWDHEEDGE